MAKRKKNQTKAIWLTFFGLAALGLLVAALLRGHDVILFNPKGLIAGEQRRLMVVSTLIMLGFCVPVLTVLYFFAWKYRETNEKAHYNPHAGRGKWSVLAVWGMPIIIMLILASIMIPATFRLEPQDRIASGKPPLTIQVVALRWKWLFIYPDQNIATINYLQIPEDTPVQFELTADETPMSSFWIPHLGGQLYAMTEHVNRLNLIADTPGEYEGSAAEINGAGFAGMRFTTRVSSQAEFNTWVDGTRQSPSYYPLTTAEYARLLQPSENNAATFYAGRDPNIYTNILDKYAGSHAGSHGQDTEPKVHEGHH
jgi:cytochrome o ubiquinol oxidase subunit 2